MNEKTWEESKLHTNAIKKCFHRSNIYAAISELCKIKENVNGDLKSELKNII